MLVKQSSHPSIPSIALFLLAICGLGCLLYGFYFSRVVSNVGLLLSGTFALIHWKDLGVLLKDKWFYTIIGIVGIVIISDVLWEGKNFFMYHGVMKAALLVYPMLLYTVLKKYASLKFWIPMVIIVSVLLSTIYSLSAYIIDFEHINQSYKSSGILPVLSYGDHIRIAWMSVISIVLAFQCLGSTSSRALKIFLYSFIVLELVFLHILGSKTGLITLYIALFVLFLYALPTKYVWLSPLIIAVIIALPIAAYHIFPTFKERVHFIKYDFEHYSQGRYRPGLSDAIRLYSIQAGMSFIKESPILGKGFSRLRNLTREWYVKEQPDVPPSSYFLPSSEFLIYWAGGGILGLMAILWHILFPFFKKEFVRDKFFTAFFLGAAVCFLFETPLEGQLPLFVYGFFISWFWMMAKYFRKEQYPGNNLSS